MTTNTEITVTYDTNKPSWDTTAYRTSYVDTDDAPHELRQVGPVFNGIVTYRGVYAAKPDAVAAAHRYIRTSATSHQLDHYPDDYGMVTTRPVNWDEGPMTEEVAQQLSRTAERRRYTVVWEGKTSSAGYQNGTRLWHKVNPGE